VQNRIAAVTTAALAVVGLGACSSSQGQIASTASVSVNGNDSKINVVSCDQVEWFRTIHIGTDTAGAKVVIDEREHPLTAISVHIDNLGGFTGMYSKDNGDAATTSLNGDKFTVSGTVNGFKTDKPGEPASSTFKITAAC
jgi:Mycobacterium 19 kDa lipoprotein antigen